MSRQLATFYLGDRYMGIDVARVQEVLRFQAMTPVPLAPEGVAGLLNLRGQIVTAIDLRQRFDLPTDGPTLPSNIVVAGVDGPVSLLVDRVGDVRLVDEEDFEDLPDTLQGDARQFIRGAFKLNDAILLELDLDRTVRGAE